ncbi:methyl-accepting chemotaxis protein [Virgibacillus salarius]|uniref:methyl-accepting chemotaxis protein n=1 Tax=Virgibacillus salarius TaxID=447199 RepID=UPI002490A19E|nr:methyl-accepting chemotaxis protein [Virgibacillus salarius]WBX78607.1 methyl-accepting chemotaxis protein [Virgibacillus salarius]
MTFANAEKLAETNIHPLLQSFVTVGPFLQSLINDDITIGIYDTEKLVINFPAETFSLNVNPDDPLVEGDIVTNAILENKNQAAIVPAELFGVNLIARAIPLHDEEGNVIGGVGVGLSVEKANQLSEVATNLSAVFDDVTNTIQDMAESITGLASNMSFISEKATEVTNRVDTIEKVSNVVKGIADQSNLLGLNAAIESARAGEHGRGFSVVADEIRNMAANSKDQVTEIHTITDNIKEVISNLDTYIQDANLESDSQSAAIEELTATMQEINGNIHTLAQLAKENIQLKN